MSINLQLKQIELANWQKKNFGIPDDHLWRMFCGMVEEVGELAHFILKGKQNIREGINGIDHEVIADCVFDTWIYSLQVLTELGIDAEPEFKKTIEIVLARDWKKYPFDGRTK